MFHQIIPRERVQFTDGLCASDSSPDDWHSTEKHEIARAKEVCERCSIRVDCLDYSIRNDERFGVWGGLNHDERGFFHKTRF